jgi:ribokinase
VVVGSANTDLVVSVPRIPAPGETVLGGDVQTIPGGKGANQAVAAARLGGSVTFIARVGADGYGEAAIAGYQREGIDTRYVLPTSGVPSGIALIAVGPNGENSIVVAPGANAHLSAADIEAAKDAFDAADVIVISLEISDAAVTAAVMAGHTRGKTVILNPAPARPLSPELLSQVTILTPNETEQIQLGGRDSLIALVGKAVITTLGEHGAEIATRTAIEHIPTRVVTAIDTVAAGDCFTGALAVELAAGHSLTDAVRFANAAAALKVTRSGAQPGLPTRAEVEAFR